LVLTLIFYVWNYLIALDSVKRLRCAGGGPSNVTQQFFLLERREEREGERGEREGERGEREGERGGERGRRESERRVERVRGEWEWREWEWEESESKRGRGERRVRGENDRSVKVEGERGEERWEEGWSGLGNHLSTLLF
jgi:hypothetical protein